MTHFQFGIKHLYTNIVMYASMLFKYVFNYFYIKRISINNKNQHIVNFTINTTINNRYHCYMRILVFILRYVAIIECRMFIFKRFYVIIYDSLLFLWFYQLNIVFNNYFLNCHNRFWTLKGVWHFIIFYKIIFLPRCFI